jgi:signal transduction histidine kinase
MGGHGRLGIAAAGAGVLSLGADAVLLATGTRYAQGMNPANALGLVEVAVLAVLTVLAVRRSRPGLAVPAALAVPLWLLRFGPPTRSAASVGGYAAWAMLAVVAVGVGRYLRAVDDRRIRAVAAAQRAQRLALAADLHDFVVHDVHEMLLHAQAGQVLADRTGRLGDVLRRIERTALRALETVDRTVDLLREESTVDGASRVPQPVVSDLPSLVDRFTATGTTVATLDLQPPEDLPPDVSATVYRIVVEALTNVRRHAPGAGRVRVAVTPAPGDAVRVEVADDGRQPARQSPGGTGLAGLTARVEALGGTLTAGRREPAGWRVDATIPVAR